MIANFFIFFNLNYFHAFFEVPGSTRSENLADDLNPDSLTVLKDCLIEGSLKDAKPGDVFQFMRQGYFCIDKDSTPDNIIINRTVDLKSSWGK